MVQRLAILVGGLGATAILTLALGGAGLFRAAPAPPIQAVDASTVNAPAETSAPTADPSPTVETVTDKVYVEPQPTAPVIHVNRAPRTRTATNTATPRPRVASAPSGETEDGYESSGTGGGEDDGGSRGGGDD